MSLIFYSKTGDGGYGDRLVGLISVYMISKIMNKKFYILWESPNICKFVENKYECTENIDNVTSLRLIDEKCDVYRKRLEIEKLEDIFPYESIKISCNQNIVQHLYLNKNYDLNMVNYTNDIVDAYKKIYTEFFVPKENLNLIVNSMINKFAEYDKVIGIHIRTGDLNMGLTQHILYDKNSLDDLIEKIIYKLKTMFSCEYAIYIMSDFTGIEKIFEKYTNNKIFYHDFEVMHIDMIRGDNNIDDGMLKLFADHITYSKCDVNIVHTSSNLGRTGAIIGDGKKYSIGIGFIDKISVKSLSSKNLYI